MTRAKLRMVALAICLYCTGVETESVDICFYREAKELKIYDFIILHKQAVVYSDFGIHPLSRSVFKYVKTNWLGVFSML